MPRVNQVRSSRSVVRALEGLDDVAPKTRRAAKPAAKATKPAAKKAVRKAVPKVKTVTKTVQRVARTAKPAAKTPRATRTDKTVKAPARKTTAKTSTRRAASPAVKEVQKLDLKPYKYVLNKTQLAAELAERSGADAKTVKAVMGSLQELMQASLMPRGAGEFRLPGVLTIKTKKVAATKGGVTRHNHMTGEDYVTKAKPATVRVRARAGNQLKIAALQ